MALEIRPFREEEFQAFLRIPAIVFANYPGEEGVGAATGLVRNAMGDAGIRPEWSLCAFEDGQLATSYGAFPLVIRLNGAKAPMAGVSVVGTLPWYRRRGHLRRITETDFKRRYEQRMEPIAGLLASIAAIYQRYGYAVCSTAVRYQIDPRMVNFAPAVPLAEGTWREGSKDELPLLERVYREYSTRRNGYLHRAPAIWDGQVMGNMPGGLAPEGFGPSLIAVYEERGEPRGYVVYVAKHFEQSPVDNAGPGQRVLVRDFVWNTRGAYRAGWELLKTFDLANRIWVNSAPVDDPAPHIMLDPRELHATHRDHLLCRIIDVERALLLRPYGAEGRVVFELRDEMCPWNAGRWALEAGTEGASVTRTKESPQLTLDVSALAQLLFGQVSPLQAVRYARADAAADAPLTLWDAMWRTEYAPFCPDWF
jgi:predicted acetyltransferase